MKYAVLGAGGLGGLIGGALGRAGRQVTLIMRPESAKRHPRLLSVKSPLLGDFEAPISLATEVADADAVWITVKATQLDEALTALPAAKVGQALIIPLLNGVDHIAKLRTLYPAAGVVAGTIRVESERTAPGVIRQLSPFCLIALAAVGPSARRAERVAVEVRAAGLTCETVEDEPSMLWSKLVFLAPLALTTTAKAAPLGEVRGDPIWRKRLETSLKEACQAAEMHGAKVDAQANLSLLNSFPDSMRSSMQKDVEAGRTPELDAIAGPIVRAGHDHGFDVSTVEELMTMIAAQLKEK